MEELDQQTADYLKTLLAKDLHELRDDEKGFIRARKDYLSKDDKKKFADVLEEKVDAKKEQKAKEKAEAKAEKVTYNELKEKAKKLGLPYVGISREDLEVSISTIEGPAGASQPE